MRILKLRPSLVSGVLLSFICSGCGTIISRTAAGSMAYWDNKHPFAPVYPATCLDSVAVFGAGADETGNQVGQRIAYFFDYPFSLTVDTLLLPFDIYRASSTP